jgi:multiple sugar transport system permease protein
MAVTVFHIVFAWNDYFGPLIYLSTARDKWPISIALPIQRDLRPAAAAHPGWRADGPDRPLLLFVVAQRFFVQGIVITGVEK